MKTIKVKYWLDRPCNFTGIVECYNGDNIWLLNGKRHRVDGPASECAGGDKYWFLNGVRMTEEEHYKRTAWTRTTLGKLIFNEHFTLDGE
jgi:hypothetical protein